LEGTPTYPSPTLARTPGVSCEPKITARPIPRLGSNAETNSSTYPTTFSKVTKIFLGSNKAAFEPKVTRGRAGSIHVKLRGASDHS